MRFGVQIYGVSKMFATDPAVFVKKLSQMGYRYLEPAVTVEENPEIQEETGVLSLDAFFKLKDLIRENGMSVNSIHLLADNVEPYAEKIRAAAIEMGIRQIICPLPTEISEESFAKAAESLCRMADYFAEAGIELLLHNNKAVSVEKIGGKSAYEWILNACKGKVFAQADVGWLLYAGIDPETFLWAHEDLVRSLHYKDMKLVEGELTETAVGTGLLDMMACFQFARYAEIIQLVDQDSGQGDIMTDYENAMNLMRGLSQGRNHSKSILSVMDIETGLVTELKTFDGVIEAPNWYQQDDDFLFYNADGHIYRYQISTGESVMLESGKCNNCNNDHVISSDGKEIAVSHSDTGWMSQVYIFPIEGGEPRLITEQFPSFLHGWSNDKKELAYCAFRMNEKQEMNVDIYTIPYEGGQEKALTHDAGFNDGPEYSPDDQYILFISTRSGLMQNWRMKRDGSEQTQMTFSERNNWFGHYSPDGKKIVYLSYSKEGLDPNEHLPNMKVQLGLMNADSSDDHVILDFFGGQGSINVNSWNPDSRRFAFVKYVLEHK